MRQPPLWRSFGHALEGVVYTLRTQRNARVQLLIGAAVVAIAAWLEVERREWALLAIAIGAVFAAESINTVVEALVDLLSPDYHDQAKTAKDVAAGAVLIVSLSAVAVGLLVFIPPLWQLFK